MYKSIILIFYFLFECSCGGVYNVLDYGAKGDGKTLNTKALQTVIDTIDKAGGGMMLFPPNSGTFVSGSLFLCSNIIVSVGTGTTLLGSQNQSDFPMTYSRAEGTMQDVHGSLINGGTCLQMVTPPDPNRGDQCQQWKKLKNVTLAGGGMIDGSGSVWWSNTTNTRPTLLGLLWINSLVIANLSLQNSPFWNVHPTFCNQIEIYNLNIYAPYSSPNTDGIDPDSSNNTYIHDCTIDVGDDCIAIKSGKDLNGRQVGMPTENLLIERMQFKHGHGVAIGSEMSGGVRNVTIKNCDCSGTDRALRIKTCRGRGGVVENIRYEDFTVPNVTEVININMYYCTNPITPEGTPTFRNIYANNFTASLATTAGEVMCLPESPCTNVTFNNIHVKNYTNGFTCEYAYGTQTNVTPPSCLLP